MQQAIRFADAGDIQRAFDLTLLCQCHNLNARAVLEKAGPRAVGKYLEEVGSQAQFKK
jgi:hypothetical protein